MKYVANEEPIERAIEYASSIAFIYLWWFKLQLSIEIINGNERGGSMCWYKNYLWKCIRRVQDWGESILSYGGGQNNISKENSIYMNGWKYRYPMGLKHLYVRVQGDRLTGYLHDGNQTANVPVHTSACLSARTLTVTLITSLYETTHHEVLHSSLEHRLPFMPRSEQRSSDHLERSGWI